MKWIEFAKNVVVKAVNYGVVAFTGYEVGNALEKNEAKRETITIIQEKQGNSIEATHIAIILAAIVLIALLFASVHELIKCTKKNNTMKLESVQVQQVQQQQQPSPNNEIQMQPIPRKL